MGVTKLSARMSRSEARRVVQEEAAKRWRDQRKGGSFCTLVVVLVVVKGLFNFLM